MLSTSTTSKAVAAATTIALAWALSACGAEEPAGESTPTPEPEASVEPAADDAATTELPADFDDIPLPDDYVVVEIDDSDPDGGVAALLTVPASWEDTADFYREQLPANGWTVDADEPSDGAGTYIAASRDDLEAWVLIDDADGDTELVVAIGPLTAYVDEDAGEAEDGTEMESFMVDLPEGFPAGVDLPLFIPSELVTGVDHGDDMWVLEYVATTDMETVGAAIDDDIALKGWTVTDQSPEGPGTKYELEKSGNELILVILPERINEADTSLHYTLRG